MLTNRDYDQMIELVPAEEADLSSPPEDMYMPEAPSVIKSVCEDDDRTVVNDTWQAPYKYLWFQPESMLCLIL